MPFLSESRSRRAWRRQVAEYVLDRVDDEGWIRFHSRAPNARDEMLRVAQLLPNDVIAEIFEDPYDPHIVFLELRLAPAPIQLDAGFKIVHPEPTVYNYEVPGDRAEREAAGW